MKGPEAEMTDYVPVSVKRHRDKRWHRPQDYAFAANQAVIPVVGRELPKAALSMPVGFIHQDDRFHLVALVGIRPDQNLYLTPQHRWAGAYPPAVLRAHPFRMLAAQEQTVLGVDEASGLVDEDASGERFFDAAGEPSPRFQEMIEFLEALNRDQHLTQQACEALRRHRLIQPWALKIQLDEQRQQAVEGLYRIDEAALAALDAEALKAVQDAGGLNLAYCQMLSQQNLDTLARLHQAHAQHRARPGSDLAEMLSLDEEDRFEFNFH